MSDSCVPYILEDFGIRKQMFDGNNALLHQIPSISDSASVTGKLSFGGDASVGLFGKNTNIWEYFAIRRSNNQLVFHCSGSNVALWEVLEENFDNREFTFTLTKETLDADCDGNKDDIRVGIWIDNSMHDNQYFYLLDYDQTVMSIVMDYSIASIAVKDSVAIEECNLSQIPAGYLVVGSGDLYVNHDKKENGTALTAPGDYIVRKVDKKSSVERVSVYTPGDAHADGTIDVRDLVAVRKVVSKIRIATQAGEYAANLNGDERVDVTDMELLRDELVKKKNEVTTMKKQEYLLDKNVMPIAGYYGPRRIITEEAYGHQAENYNTVTDEIFQKLHALGINVITSTGNDCRDEAVDKTENLDLLSLAEKYNMGVFLDDTRINNNTTTEELAGYLSDYTNYRSYLGTSIVDEPYTSTYGKQHYDKGIQPMEQYAGISKLVNSYSNMWGYVNLNPLTYMLYNPDWRSLVSEDGLDWTNYWKKYEQDYDDMLSVYGKYLDDYLTTYQPKMISYDYYVFDQKTIAGSQFTTKAYFDNMAIVREKALEYNIPFWVSVQAGSNWNDSMSEMDSNLNPDKTPTQGEMLWNVNTSLAYGAKGLTYFPLIQPYWFAYAEGGTWDYGRNGLLGANGQPTAWYDRAKKTNAWISEIDHILMNAESKKVLAVGSTALEETSLTSSSYGPLTSVSTDKFFVQAQAIVGVFDYQGKTAFYVVNYKTDESQNIKLNFEKSLTYSGFAQLKNTDNQSTPVSGTGQSLTLDLEAGGAAIIIVE